MSLQQIGQYRLDSLLGVGGMGEVYRAYDLHRDRVVALKLLPEALSADAEYLQRFRRESHVAARLREPHVVPIHDWGEVEGRLFIDMRLVDGQNVRDILAEGGAMSPAKAVSIIGQVAEALDAAHTDGLVHRDIKPSNIIVTPSGFVYVVDFGIARSIGTARTSLTITGVTVGTLDYMAPERFTNETVDGRTDVYSLGCLLHECLTGSQPFPGEDLPSLMYAHLYTNAPAPNTVNPNVSTLFDAVVAKGMAKSAADRYPTAGALAQAAGAALAAGSIPAQRVADDVDRKAAARVGARPPRPAPDESTATQGRAGFAHEAPENEVVAPVPDVPARSSSPIGWNPVPPNRPTPSAPSALPPPPFPPTRTQPGSGKASRRWVVVALPLVAALIAVIVLVRPGRGVGTDTTSGGALPPAAADVAASVAVPTVRETVTAGTTPGYLEVAPNARSAYIANRDAGYVSVLDTTINKVTATIPIPAGPPQFVSFSPDGRRAYVSIFNTERTVHLIGVLDTRTNTLLATIPVGTRPFASATSPDGSLLYVPSHDDGRLDVIDTVSNTVKFTIPVPKNPHWVAFGRDGKRFYTANHESGIVSVLAAATNTVLTTIPVGKSPHSTAVSPDGTRVAVVNFDSNNVSVIDTTTNAVVATIAVGQRPQDIAYVPDGHYLYAANVDSDTVSVIDATTNQVTATIPTGDGPTSIAMLPNGRQAYVTNLNAGTILVLDITAS